MIESLGWIASLLFGFCGAPQAYDSIKNGHSQGVSKAFILMWLTAEVLMQIYVINKHGFDMPLLVNYWLNTLFCGIIGFYAFFPRSLA